MFSTMKNAWAIPDLRKKILSTLSIIVVFRFDAMITVPFLNVEALQGLMGQVGKSGNTLGYLDVLFGGTFASATLFATSVIPYISSSIILQLLTAALSPLERLAKKGEEGCKKIAVIARYVTAVLGLIQGIAYHFYLHNSSYEGTPITIFNSGWEQAPSAATIISTFTTGMALMMRMGGQVNRYGIDNGTSILLLSDTVMRMPHIMNMPGKYLQIVNQDPSAYDKYYVFVPIFVVLFLAVIWFIILMNNSECRIPTQCAERIAGRKMYGGQASHIPIKIAMFGVIPIIFANSVLAIPNTIQLFTSPKSGFWEGFLDAFSSTGWVYLLVHLLLTVVFAYFYVIIQCNPIEMASNLHQSNGMIPGVRPGKPTPGFISRILSKLILIGALFLAVAALPPIIFGAAAGIHNMSLGGTSLIILVGVTLDTVRWVEPQMMMRHCKGLLD